MLPDTNPNRGRLRDWAQDEELRARVRHAHATAEHEALQQQLAALRAVLDRLTTGGVAGETAGALAHRDRACEELREQAAGLAAEVDVARGQVEATAAQATAAGQQALGLDRLVTAAAQQRQVGQQRAEQRALDEHGTQAALKRE